MNIKSDLYNAIEDKNIVSITTNNGIQGYFAPLLIAKSLKDKRIDIVFCHFYKDTDYSIKITEENINAQTIQIKEIEYLHTQPNMYFTHSLNSSLYGFTDVYVCVSSDLGN